MIIKSFRLKRSLLEAFALGIFGGILVCQGTILTIDTFKAQLKKEIIIELITAIQHAQQQRPNSYTI